MSAEKRSIPKLTKKQHDPKRFDRRRLAAALFHQELRLDQPHDEQPSDQAQASERPDEENTTHGA